MLALLPWPTPENLRPPIMRGTSVFSQDTHAIFLDTEPGFGWDNRFRFGGCAPGEDSVDDPVRLGAALRLAELRSPWAGLIDFIEYGAAAYRGKLKYRAKKQMKTHSPQLCQEVTFWELMLKVHSFWSCLKWGQR